MLTTAIVPLKPTARAKSRLGFDREIRSRLANAMAIDLVKSCQASERVTNVIVAGMAPTELSVTVVPDTATGLNPAIAAALASLRPDEQAMVLLGDLPCVRSEDIDIAMTLADAQLSRDASPAAIICDAAGTGTTTLIGQAGTLSPQFGPRSRARHRNQGYRELEYRKLFRLRRDVDSVTDLADAVRIGTGAATTAIAQEILF